MKSDTVASRLVAQTWDKVGGDTPTFYGVITFLDKELARFSIARSDYTQDVCMPCASTLKRLRNEVAKILREEYGE